LSKSWGKVIWS